MTKSTTATIEDVASLAGVSTSTVSNVLNKRESRMRADTLERVRRAIAELGFRPNQSARRLKTGHMPMLGLLVPSIANPFFGALVRWTEEAATARGYGVLLCNTQRSPQRELEYARAFMAQGVRCVIIGAPLQAQQYLAPLIENGLAAVGFDRSAVPGRMQMDHVSLDNRRAGELAAEHLLSLGHRSIAYVSAPVDSSNRLQRLEGARQACARHGVVLQAHIDEGTDAHAELELAELGRVAARTLTSGARRATGFVAMNDTVAIGVMAGLRDAGLRVPDDVSVVGIDDLFVGHYVSPGLTTVRQPMKAMAAAAVDRVLARLKRPDDPAHEQIFLPEMVVRESTIRCRTIANRRKQAA
ncbi:LacI family DNA-binding transcriptional regulator [Piscinibacter sakaiensis]|uniref:LacI family DNA-binding transcriptional regulator n=1 Tax=Piscinibacter sakaiensis TaxID=1547922 RepID=UPI003AB0059C